ncbi:hypothetical protein Rsub_12465 [Raphidocelis subcapitata]|uniref:Uncharacterized protein n=1 Tax=Raphidocelis subcapitata TaxID=307507 RepID=A0A2V0PHG7_9CHLO|nr:hypothetical protein Rsub_12465 [Raphidocelis subcapitata]|eukprot:GBF99206.1 hypothetical protein Rsub_12465 [Raphidocelis subcapitata]
MASCGSLKSIAPALQRPGPLPRGATPAAAARRAGHAPLRCCCAGAGVRGQQQQQQQQQQQHEHPSASRRAVLASLPLAAVAAALASPPRAAAAPAAAPGSNDAVLGSLRRLQKQQRLFGDEPPQSALQQRFEAAQAQLQRIELLLKISEDGGQYDSARLKLREGAFKTLRLDLGYAQELTRVVPQKAVREVIEGVEHLDGALKRREPTEEVRQQIARLSGLIGGVAEAVARLEDLQ